jgi:hypothetical protein
MRGTFRIGRGHDSGREEIIAVVTAGLTVALLVYTVKIARLNEIRVHNGATTNKILADIRGKMEGEKYAKLQTTNNQTQSGHNHPGNVDSD